MSKRQSVMKHDFSKIASANIPRSSFDRSHGYKTTFDAGLLIPFFCDEVLPGDTFNTRVTAFARLATPLKPIMDNLFMDFHFFFIPHRQVWEDFRKMMGERANVNDSIDYTVPHSTPPLGGWTTGSFFDYLGVPLGVEGISVSALPIRSYLHCYNEWFRDQNTMNSATFNITSGDTETTGALRNRAKRHDYFTSALPWPQKGDPSSIALGGVAPIFSENATNAILSVEYGRGGADVSLATNGGVGLDRVYADNATAASNRLLADLDAATTVTVNALRESFQIQKLLERDARGGTRYSEIVRSHFGVEFFDVTYRPEYLGGGSVPVNLTPIAQTSGTAIDPATGYTAEPQGNLAAMGTATANGIGFTKSFTEHGLVLGLVSVRADLTYQQGIERGWSRRTRYDYYWPSLSHLGEQAILSKELYADGSPEDDSVFGYQERYAEYRYKPSKITGKFRSSDPETLDFWHLSQVFGTRPTLDITFMNESPPLDRCIAVPSEPHFLFDAYINHRCARPMPVHAVPGLIDHF